jgi:hypothetical protein
MHPTWLRRTTTAAAAAAAASAAKNIHCHSVFRFLELVFFWFVGNRVSRKNFFRRGIGPNEHQFKGINVKQRCL